LLENVVLSLCVLLVVEVTQPHTESEAIKMSTMIARNFFSIQIPFDEKINQTGKTAA
jgi:hypothetical protein